MRAVGFGMLVRALGRFGEFLFPIGSVTPLLEWFWLTMFCVVNSVILHLIVSVKSESDLT